MKVKEFVEMYKKNNAMDMKKALEVNEYVSIAVKQKMAEVVLENCTQTIDGEIRMNSLDRYILFMISVISLHTNLEFDDKEDESHSGTEDYDLLCKNHLLEKIISLFKDDYDSCQVVLDMMTADMLQNKLTLEKKLYMFLDQCTTILKDATDELVEKVDLSALENLNIKNAELLNFLGMSQNNSQ